MGSYWSTERLTNGVAAQIFATAFEDGSYDAEIIHGILPGGSAELADTSCLNRDTIRTINEGSMEIEQKFNDFAYKVNRNSSNSGSFANQQGILVKSRQFRKQTEVITDIGCLMTIFIRNLLHDILQLTHLIN